MTSPRRLLLDALEAKGWTLVHLLRASGLTCTRASLHRKLYGYRKSGSADRIYQPISLDEYRKLAGALDVLSDEDAEVFERLGLGGLGRERGVIASARRCQVASRPPRRWTPTVAADRRLAKGQRAARTGVLSRSPATEVA